MFSIEMKINGATVVHIAGHNKGIFDLDHPLMHSYDYSYFDVNKRSLTNGSIVHHRPSGIEGLARVILDDLEKIRAKEILEEN